jgi:hypothetical protein
MSFWFLSAFLFSFVDVDRFFDSPCRFSCIYTLFGVLSFHTVLFSVWFLLFICFLLGDTDWFPFLLRYRLLWPSKPLIHLALSGDPGYETKVVVRICLADGIDMFLALLVMDGSCMIDQLYGNSLEPSWCSGNQFLSGFQNFWKSFLFQNVPPCYRQMILRLIIITFLIY